MTDEIVLPILLQQGRRAYVHAIRHRLDAVGCGDLPPMGSRVLGAMGRYPDEDHDVARLTERSKQAASQLIDQMVMRGYVTREPHPEDRRRIVLALTERGTLAAKEIRQAVDDTDAQLLDAVGADDVAVLRRALYALMTSSTSDTSPSAIV